MTIIFRVFPLIFLITFHIGCISVEPKRIVLKPFTGNMTSVAAETASMRILSRPEMEYPKEERRNGVQGTTQLIFRLDANGVVEEVWLDKSSGSSNLDQAAARMMLATQYEGGHPGIYRHEYSFLLKKRED